MIEDSFDKFTRTLGTRIYFYTFFPYNTFASCASLYQILKVLTLCVKTQQYYDKNVDNGATVSTAYFVGLI